MEKWVSLWRRVKKVKERKKTLNKNQRVTRRRKGMALGLGKKRWIRNLGLLKRQQRTR